MKQIYGLFRTCTEYDTWEEIVGISESAFRLRTMATKKNNENRREFARKIEYAKNTLEIANYPKSLEGLCEENKWFVKKLDWI